jgi:hypothetical protein
LVCLHSVTTNLTTTPRTPFAACNIAIKLILIFDLQMKFSDLLSKSKIILF